MVGWLTRLWRFSTGVMGWLTFYGAEVADRTRSVNRISEEVLNTIVDEAVETVRQELLKLKSMSKLYVAVLKSFSTGGKSWSEVRTSPMDELGRTVTNAQSSRVLRSLERLSYLQRVRTICLQERL
ncbi:MAG: hypothetical protein QXO30_03040 [Candidatus Caldarchaeum sp.]